MDLLFRLFIAAVCLCIVTKAYASKVGCNDNLPVGESMMGYPITQGSKILTVTRGSSSVVTGSTYTPGKLKSSP